MGASSVPKTASRRSTASLRWRWRNRSIALSITTCLAKPGGPFGGRHLEDSVQVEVEPDQDLVAGRDFGQPLDHELADQGVVARVLVLALEDADLRGTPDRRRPSSRSRSGWRAAACCAR